MNQVVKRRLRAPSQDCAALIDPPLSEVGALLQRNRTLVADFQRESGFPAALNQQARAAILDPPRLFTERAHNLDPARPIIATGHQPELYHAGVWFKNFIAASLARHCGGHAANLVVDNDLIRVPGIRLPTIGSSGPQVAEVLFDAPLEAATWENRYLVNEAVFREFATNVRRSIEPLASSEDFKHGIILDRLWPYAIQSLEEQDKQFLDFAKALSTHFELPKIACPTYCMLGTCLTAARQRLEGEIGLSMYDTPVSEIAGQPAFLEFVRLLLLRHRELHSVHNEALAEYRVVNRIRSQSHPVPELARQDEWFEIPLWLGTFGYFGRRRAFVRTTGGHFEITDRHETTVSLPTNDSAEYGKILASQQFVTLRPRALITTMYARLVLSDLFIHGIGGAKYDELTDLIIRRFFGIEPPGYVTATATFRLPIKRPGVSPDDVRASARRLRELSYRPEALLSEELVRRVPSLQPKLAALAAEKREYLARHDLRRCSRDVFARLDRLNEAMHELLAPVERELRARHDELVVQLKQAQMLSSREFSFVLFPSEILPARLLDLCKVLT